MSGKVPSADGSRCEVRGVKYLVHERPPEPIFDVDITAELVQHLEALGLPLIHRHVQCTALKTPNAATSLHSLSTWIESERVSKHGTSGADGGAEGECVRRWALGLLRRAT